MTRPNFPPYIVKGVGEDGVEREIGNPTTWWNTISFIDDTVDPVIKSFRKIIIEINVEALGPDDRLGRGDG